MNILFKWTMFACIFILSNHVISREPVRLCNPANSICITGVLEFPQNEGPHPAVVLLHGAAGWHTKYALLAGSLADSGFVALALDYYADVGSSAIGSEAKLMKWPHYQTGVRNAVAYLHTLKQVADQPVGLVGFSRGAFLAVSVAGSIPSVKAVVDFFGGGGGGPEPLKKDVQGLPPLLILHGASDSIVPLRFAYDLKEAVLDAGGTVEVHVYAEEEHGLSEATLPDALRRMTLFPKAHLAR